MNRSLLVYYSNYVVYIFVILTKKLNKHCHVLIESVVIIALYAAIKVRAYMNGTCYFNLNNIITIRTLPNSIIVCILKECDGTAQRKMKIYFWLGDPTHGAQPRRFY